MQIDERYKNDLSLAPKEKNIQIQEKTVVQVTMTIFDR